MTGMGAKRNNGYQVPPLKRSDICKACDFTHCRMLAGRDLVVLTDDVLRAASGYGLLDEVVERDPGPVVGLRDDDREQIHLAAAVPDQAEVQAPVNADPCLSGCCSMQRT